MTAAKSAGTTRKTSECGREEPRRLGGRREVDAEQDRGDADGGDREADHEARGDDPVRAEEAGQGGRADEEDEDGDHGLDREVGGDDEDGERRDGGEVRAPREADPVEPGVRGHRLRATAPGRPTRPTRPARVHGQ